MADTNRMDDPNNDRDNGTTERDSDPYRDKDMDPNNNDRDRDRQTQPGQELPGNDQLEDEDLDEELELDGEEDEQI